MCFARVPDIGLSAPSVDISTTIWGSVQCDWRRSGLTLDGLGATVVEFGAVLCKGSVRRLVCLWVFLVHLCSAEILRYTGCLLVC